MASIRIYLLGQSNAMPVTDAPDSVTGGSISGSALAWTSMAWAPSDTPHRITPWRTQRVKKGPPLHRSICGLDVSMISRLVALGHQPHLIQVAEGSTTLANHWLPPSGKLWTRFLRQRTAALASSRCPADPGLAQTVCVWSQGETDAAGGTDGAYATNLATWAAAYRSTVGANAKILIVRLHASCTQGTSGARDAIRAAQTAFVAGDGGSSALFVPDSFPLYDDAHRTTAASLSEGTAIADAIVALLGLG